MYTCAHFGDGFGVVCATVVSILEKFMNYFFKLGIGANVSEIFMKTSSAFECPRLQIEAGINRLHILVRIQLTYVRLYK